MIEKLNPNVAIVAAGVLIVAGGAWYAARKLGIVDGQSLANAVNPSHQDNLANRAFNGVVKPLTGGRSFGEWLYDFTHNPVDMGTTPFAGADFGDVRGGSSSTLDRDLSQLSFIQGA